MADYDYISKYNSSSNTTYYLRTKAPGKNSLWWEGRDNALIASISIPSGKYVPLLSTKSTSGSWEMGCYDNAENNYANSLIFSYISDTDYANHTTSPSTSGAVKLTNTGNIILKGNLIIDNAVRGVKVKDSSGASYNLICDNGMNLWIGAWQTSSAHHVGQTLISSGYSGTAGYKSIRIAVPNATNDGATDYLVFHEGYLDVGDATDGTLSVARGGTGSSSVAINKVFAGPGSGSAGAPSFRSLVAADIPDISAAKITSGTLSASYGGTGNTSLNASANALINSLTTGGSTPVDDDYYVSQYVGGGTTTTTYHRRPVSALWTYIKGKADNTYLKLSGGALTGPVTSTSTLNLTRSTDAGANTSVATLTIGPATGVNLAFDNNEIMARNNGVASTLSLNYDGGAVSIGSGGLTTSGDITSTASGGSICAKYETNDTSGLKISIKSKTYSFGMHMGTGGSNHGFYEWTSGGDGWLILRNGTTDAISTGFHAPLAGYYIRNISYGTSAPGSSAGSNGDVFIQYFS